jgi:hypothetical protein
LPAVATEVTTQEPLPEAGPTKVAAAPPPATEESEVQSLRRKAAELSKSLQEVQLRLAALEESKE